MAQDKPKVLITGSNGQVGSELKALAPQFADFQFIYVDVEELDITSEAAVRLFFKENDLRYCINCAAYTAVDKAETDTGTAWKVNTVGPEILAKNCAIAGTRMIHLSTDYVYHTNQNVPYIETDFTNPQGVYAKTKLDGDEAVLRQHSTGAMILRTSWVYSSFGHNFVKTMLRLGPEKGKLSVVYDQIGTPTYAADLVAAILKIIQKAERREVEPVALRGIYHYSNEGVTSWYDFAQAIFDIRKLDVKVLPIETKSYPTPARRPHFSLLNKAKIRTAFGLEIPHWQVSLRACLDLL